MIFQIVWFTDTNLRNRHLPPKGFTGNHVIADDYLHAKSKLLGYITSNNVDVQGLHYDLRTSGSITLAKHHIDYTSHLGVMRCDINLFVEHSGKRPYYVSFRVNKNQANPKGIHECFDSANLSEALETYKEMVKRFTQFLADEPGNTISVIE